MPSLFSSPPKPPPSPVTGRPPVNSLLAQQLRYLQRQSGDNAAVTGNNNNVSAPPLAPPAPRTSATAITRPLTGG